MSTDVGADHQSRSVIGWESGRSPRQVCTQRSMVEFMPGTREC
ncbi:hypothetical protein [Streptomyces sp. 900105755]